jgi:eukaryotic-like serine/threonine-protein kinase
LQYRELVNGVSYIVKQKLIGGRYSLRDPLGSGGMAEVFLAHDEVLERDVALKILKERYAGDEGFVERFRREARSAASLNHPHIVHIYDWGRSEDAGGYYMAMEYAPGGTLKDRILGEGSLPPCTAVEIASQIAEALAAAHGRGVVHRDVKPQNVLLTASGEAKVADFGIARAANANATSGSGLILGTAGYMPPERAKGERAGPRSDLYSLGVVLYEMLTGEVPYAADTPATVATKHATEPPRSPREANPQVPEEIDALTLRLLAKDPDDRYGSAAELLEDLRRVRDGLPPAFANSRAVPQNPDGTGVNGGGPYVVYGRRSRKLPWALAAFAALLVLLLAGMAWDPRSGSQEQAQAQDVARGSLERFDATFEEGERAAAPKEAVPYTGGPSENEGRESSGADADALKLVDFGPASSDAVLQDGDMDQDTGADIPARPGTEALNPTASPGPERVRDPEVSGSSAQEVAQPLSDAGHVAAGTATRRSTEPTGSAEGTDSPVGTTVERGTAIAVSGGGPASRESSNGDQDATSASVPEETSAPMQPSKTRKRSKIHHTELRSRALLADDARGALRAGECRSRCE